MKRVVVVIVVVVSAACARGYNGPSGESRDGPLLAYDLPCGRVHGIVRPRPGLPDCLGDLGAAGVRFTSDGQGHHTLEAETAPGVGRCALEQVDVTLYPFAEGGTVAAGTECPFVIGFPADRAPAPSEAAARSVLPPLSPTPFDLVLRKIDRILIPAGHF